MDFEAHEKPADSCSFDEMVATIGHRLRLFCGIFAQSLLEESWRNQKTSMDWWQQSQSLRLAAAPLRQLFRSSARNDSDGITCYLQRIDQVSAVLRSRISQVANDCDNIMHIRMQHDALAFVRSAEMGLHKWLSQFPIPTNKHCSYTTTLPSETSSIWEYEHGSEHLRTAIAACEPISICMESRRQFIRAYFLAVVHPCQWTDDRHRQLVALHRNAIEVLEPSIERDSLLERLEKIQVYTPDKFTRKALEFVA